jgi:hypothetical protein
MNNDQIIDRVALYLEQHLNGTRGSLRQDEYRKDLLRLFASAYQNSKENPAGNCITGDGLLNDIAERWGLDESEQSKAKREILQCFCQMWREWQFAWDNYEIQPA